MLIRNILVSNMYCYLRYFVNNNHEKAYVGVGKLTARFGMHTLKSFIRRLVFVDIKKIINVLEVQKLQVTS
jgi:hypothetical protein